MKLGLLERWLVNSPLRRLSLHTLEPAVLRQLAPFTRGGHVLDIGCGNGQGLIMLARETAPATLAGVDLDEGQLARARANLDQAHVAATLLQADITKLPLPAQSLDLVTSFGALHHVFAWEDALAEVKRVLRPGGLFYALEFYRPLLTFVAPLAPHPPRRFSHAEFIDALKGHGFQVMGDRNVLGLWGFVAIRKPVGEAQYD